MSKGFNPQDFGIEAYTLNEKKKKKKKPDTGFISLLCCMEVLMRL